MSRPSRTAARTALALALVGAVGCAGEAEDGPRPAEPAVDPTVIPPPTPAVAPEEAATGDPAGASTPRAAPVDLGRAAYLDDRTEARVRSAIRRRVGARPTIVTSRHYRTREGGSITFAAFTAEYVERCVAGGTPREECILGGGEGALAVNVPECVFGGIARVDLGPDDGERPGRMRIVGVRPIGEGTLCGFEVETLRLADEDLDGAPEVLLSYAWTDLRYVDGERVPQAEGTVRVTMRDDLTPQVELEVGAVHHGDAGEDARNLVSQLRQIRRAGHPDLALDVIDWLATPCPEVEPPHGREECAIRERTLVYRYDPEADVWQPPSPEE